MVINKEKNFVSAVIYIYNNEMYIKNTLERINRKLSDNFEKYEIICVNDNSTDKSVDRIKEFSNKSEQAVITILNMSYHQGLELSMNAGIDFAIGDFIFEFDDIDMDYNDEIIMDVYNKSLKGFDIVSASPKRKMKKTSKLFYKLFNSYSNNSNKLKTETFRVVSRRAINRVQSLNKTIPYRKAVYANCGLKLETIYYNSNLKNNSKYLDNDTRKEVAIESLILFTNITYRASLFITLLMMLGIVLVGLYTIFIFISKKPVQGWTTTMLFLSIAFFAIFAILAVIIKYLSIIVELIFKKQEYMIESIEKLNK
ncbi:glycosyl transferase family 2 [Clostridium neonatale]|uniref:Glycosyl transferase family 2 n=1 Tax=Clostridium neonatale TaxID=137838 RepID=A0A2A7MLM5_9CLOT|nr:MULTISPECIES: glycosyltransferase [Clostridium]MDU4847382.1 glycosyltransferase [Clostridium sp.]PEG28439.1 glycosyl transferase family 2 [Clostridium neonatale]PEG32586.1 glycosyl transferase family 2 [Clostridium neonatale]CAH0438844.1 Putative glycosyltransferase [Clostridium neonatale]